MCLFSCSSVFTWFKTRVYKAFIVDILCLQVEALHAQMEEQTRLAKEQVESLLEDRRIKTEEAQAQQQRDQQRITALTDK